MSKLSTRSRLLGAFAGVSILGACAAGGPQPNATLVTNPDGSVRIVPNAQEELYCGVTTDQTGPIYGNGGQIAGGTVGRRCQNELANQGLQSQQQSTFEREAQRLTDGLASDLGNNLRQQGQQVINNMFNF